MISKDLFNMLYSELRDFESELKQIHERNLDRQLDKPHQVEEIQDILQMINLRSHNPHAVRLLHPYLEEDVFFSKETDVELYQHFRYLPAIWHSHGFFEISCVLSGCFTNYIDDQVITMQVGDVCIIAPNTLHAISAFSDDCIMGNILLRASTFETAFFGVLSENDVLSDFFRRTLYRQSPHSYLFFRTGDDTELRDYATQALWEFGRNRQYKNRMLSSIVTLFLTTLLRNHSTDILFPTLRTRQENENTILLLKYMQEHFNTVTLSELSAFFNYSERQIQRLIKEITGMSFSQNIQKLRLRKAERLMQNPDLSIADIARELGYAGTENFRHIFKKQYGMTPMEYRSMQNPAASLNLENSRPYPDSSCISRSLW